MRKKYLAVPEQEDHELLEELEQAVNQSHQTALKALVDMFNWMDTLEAKPTAEIVSLDRQSVEIGRNANTILAKMSQVSEKRKQLQWLYSSLETFKLVR